MTNGVVLTAALRSNLLSLQQTQKDIDVHQNRLATGKKVNSALDNPQAFFAAQALADRANDLSNLLDAIGQSIQVINAANNGVTALTTLVNQAQSIANSAQSTLAGASTSANTTGSVKLDGGTKLSTLTGFNGTSGDKVIITVTDSDGGFTTGDSIGSAAAGVTITTQTNWTVNDLVTNINDLNTTLNLTDTVISASLDASGHLTFSAENGGKLHIQFQSATAATPNLDQNIASSLGYAGIVGSDHFGATATLTNQSIDFTQLATQDISSNALYSSAGTLAQATTRIAAVTNSTGTALTTLTSSDTFSLIVNGKTSANLLAYSGANATTQTIQGIIDGINHDATISSLVSASFDVDTGKISLTALDSSATTVQLSYVTATNANKLSLGFGTSTLTAAAANSTVQETIRFGAAAGTLATLQSQYNTTLEQIDALVADTGYAGTNLLDGNDLTTYFNETRTSSLVTSGVTFNSNGLGLDAASFNNASSIASAINQTIAALTTVRNFGSTLSNNLSIIQNRQDFTNNLINTLKTGSDALTNADQNEEGASLLALQTRQSLGITSLSLASQAQQAILKLF